MKKIISSSAVLALIMTAGCSDKIDINKGDDGLTNETVTLSRNYDALPNVTLNRIIDMDSESAAASISRHEAYGTYTLEMEKVYFSLPTEDGSSRVVMFNEFALPSGISTGYFDHASERTLEPSLDLPLLQIDMTIRNSSSEPVVMDADLVGYKDGEVVASIHIGDDGSADALRLISVDPGAWARFILSGNGSLGEDDNAVKLAVEGLDSFLCDIPDVIALENIHMNGNASSASGIPVDFSFEFSAPLALGGKSFFTAAYDLYGLDFSIPDEAGDDMSVKSVDIEYSLRSSIPALLTFDIYPIDNEGNIIEGLVCGGYGSAFAGTGNKPSDYRNTIHIEEDEGYRGKCLIETVSGLRMSFDVHGDSEKAHQSTPLSAIDYLQFHDIRMDFDCYR